MSDLREAAEALLYVIGSDHSQAEYQGAVDTLKAAVEVDGGTVAAPTAAAAPGLVPSLADAGPADLAPAPAETPADVPAAPETDSSVGDAA